MAENRDAMIDEKEVEAVEEKALKDERDTFTLKLSPPFEYEGKKYDELVFAYGDMTGEDSLAIENELLRARNITVVEPAYNIHYIERFAARACSAQLDVRAIQMLPIKHYLKVRNRTRDFLVRAGY